MSYIISEANDPFAFDAASMQGLGEELAEAHAAAAPFPHTVIDNFLPPEIIAYCNANFPKKPGLGGLSFDRDQERYKSSFQPDTLDPKLRSLFYTFNSLPFIRVIENITGIKGLIPDPYFAGAGFHEITTGGHLSVHIDFNHHKRMGVERRVNMLIYLNDDWQDEYGGQLEFWNKDMSECVQSIVPLANRMAMFTLSNTSYHGNPNPVAHPDGKTRRSIALYYYTSTWDGTQRAHTTQFKQRSGSEDSADWTVRSRELINDFVPPVLSRQLLRLTRRMGG